MCHREKGPVQMERVGRTDPRIPPRTICAIGFRTATCGFTAFRCRPSSCGSSCTSCRCRTGTGRCGRPSRRRCGSAPASSPRRRRSSAARGVRLLRLLSLLQPRSPPRASPAHRPTAPPALPRRPLLHAEDGLRDPVADALPHRVELLHALPLVHDLRVLLGVPAQADAATQVVHRQQVRLPANCRVAPAPGSAPPSASRGGTSGRRRSAACAAASSGVTPGELRGVERQAQFRLAPSRPAPSRPRPRPTRAPLKTSSILASISSMSAGRHRLRGDLQQFLAELRAATRCGRTPRSAPRPRSPGRPRRSSPPGSARASAAGFAGQRRCPGAARPSGKARRGRSAARRPCGLSAMKFCIATRTGNSMSFCRYAARTFRYRNSFRSPSALSRDLFDRHLHAELLPHQSASASARRCGSGSAGPRTGRRP